MSRRVIRLNSAVLEDRVLHSLAAVPTLSETDEDGTKLESWIQVLKVGDFYDPRYDEFSVTRKDLRAMVANFKALNRAFPIDFDHSFAMSGDSRAAGWIKQLKVQDGGATLWALVTWTAAAADAIRGGEYRFISPEFTFAYRTETGEEIGPVMMAAALTNRPFLEGMAEVTLSVALNSAPDAPMSEVILWTTPGAGASRDERNSTVNFKKIALALGLSDDADEATILSAVAAARPADGSVVLSAADHAALKADADAGRAAAEALKTERFDRAETEGRLAPALRKPLELAYDADPEGTAKVLAELPVNPAFRAGGSGPVTDTGTGRALSVVPTGESPAPRSATQHQDQLHALAQAKVQEAQAAGRNLSYREAVYAADAELRHTA